IKNEEIEIGPVDVEWNKAIGNRMKKQRSGYKCDDVVLLDVITAAIGKELASPEQTASELAIPGQTATGKESSNPFMAGEDASKQGRIDDAEAEVTFIDEISNDARNKNNKISNSN
ncbi:hypothetical protein Tco_0508427, partial [Tanacetum coccineum]